jgi:arginine decarboxylase
MTAHHAVLICDVTEIEQLGEAAPPIPGDECHESIHALQRQLQQLDEVSSATEIYHNALFALEEIQQGFNQGVVDIAGRSQAEQYYHAICRKLVSRLNPAKRHHHEILTELNEILADKVFCNFSIFQSIPDVWAIDQIFPIVPLQRLDEEPRRRAILHDLTCDSDGRIDLYVEDDGIENTLPIHDIEPGEPYLLGFFLVGAYQETLGDIHNLFGDTATANVSLDGDGNITLENIFAGENVSHLLARVEYEPEEVRARILGRARAARLPESEREQLLHDLESSLESYSYLVREEIG